MTKKVLVNGCSFTHGHGEVQDVTTGKTNPPQPYVWPFRLEELFDGKIEAINYGFGGGSNNRIARTTIEGVRKHNPDLVVIQWTSPFRYEFWNEEWNQYFGLVPTNSVRDDQTNRNTKALDEFGHPLVWIPHEGREAGGNKEISKKFGYQTDYYKNVKKASQMYQAYLMNHHETMVNYCKDILLIQNFLSNKNIPFLFSSMSSICHMGRPTGGIDHVWNILSTKPNTFLIQLREMIDRRRWTMYPFSAMMAGHVVSPDGMHPNDEGHRRIATELYKEIVNRELIEDN